MDAFQRTDGDAASELARNRRSVREAPLQSCVPLQQPRKANGAAGAALVVSVTQGATSYRGGIAGAVL